MSTQPAPFGWKSAPLADTESRITTFLQTPGGMQTQLNDDQIVEAVLNGTNRIWVDVDSNYTNDWVDLARRLHLHPLSIEDTLSAQSRIKIEEYDNYLFVVARDTSFDTKTSDPYDFVSCNIYLYIGHHFLITVHEHPSRATNTLIDRLTGAPDLIERGIDYLAYAVLDTVVDLYFPLLDEIDSFVDELETDIFKKADTQKTLACIFDLKRTLLALRRQQAPLREILATMSNRPTPYLAPTTQIYFRDVYDHVVRQVESIETYRDLLSGALEIYFSVISNRMNEIMKALTIVGTLLLPATWIASIYGMNFDRMPLLHHPLGFWFAMIIMVGISVVLMVYLKMKHWV